MSDVQIVRLTFSGAATPYWVSLGQGDPVKPDRSSSFSISSIENQNLIVLTPTLAWTCPPTPVAGGEVPSPASRPSNVQPEYAATPRYEPQTNCDAPIQPFVSPEAATFISRHRLEEHLLEATRLSRECFSIAETPLVSHEVDPEDDSQYLVIEIKVRGDVLQNVEAHKRYAKAWAQTAQWPYFDMIRLVYDLA
jgi:hypothetical protein